MEVARELHRTVIKKFTKRQILTKGIDDLWAADLLIMSAYSRQNKGFKYILNVIDTFSKYLFLVPLKKKTGEETAKAFESIIKKSKRKPKLLHVDCGKEFVNGTFTKMLKKYDIKMYHTFNEEKSSIAERVNRTVNQKLKFYFEVNNNHKWVQLLPQILDEYNNKNVHRTIGLPPSKVTKKNEKEIFERMYPLNKFKLQHPFFKIGDRVRITRKKELFSNKYERNWTTEIFLIDKIYYTNPITYSVKDLDGEEILGKFYKYELQLTKF